MTTKTYKSNSCIAINVVLPNKTNLHIAFTPQTLQGSSFTTSNKDIQDAIEKHHGFKRLFRLEKVMETKDEVEDENIVKVPKDDIPPIPVPDEDDVASKGNTIKEDTVADAMTKVEVSDLVSAREYLAEKFGIEKKTILSKASILETAKTYNIEFVGLE